MKKNKLRYLSVVSLLAMCFCFTSCLTYSIVSAVISAKKKAKTTQQQGQTVTEEYGKTVTLVTSGSGATKEDATRNALRSAIEQTFGTFVSSNTKVVNDELISDAIATISSGDVLSYEQISCVDTQNGYQVSVKAVVSIGGLVSFVQNKGMETDLAGNTFLQNRNLAILKRKNEFVALNNLVDQLVLLQSQIFDFSLEVEQPKGDGLFEVEVKVTASPNSNFDKFRDIIDKTLSSLSMSPQERENYESLGMKSYWYGLYYGLHFRNYDRMCLLCTKGTIQSDTHRQYYLRTDFEGLHDGKPDVGKPDVVPLIDIINNILEVSICGFEIYDNIGTVITPTIQKEKKSRDFRYYKYIYSLCSDRVDYVWVPGEVTYGILFHPTGVQGGARILESRWNDCGGDFTLGYDESQLSKLKKISVRPYALTFFNQKKNNISVH